MHLLMSFRYRFCVKTRLFFVLSLIAQRVGICCREVQTPGGDEATEDPEGGLVPSKESLEMALTQDS